MAETTVTIGDTEVQIEETDDGFEATPVEEDDFVQYLEEEHCSGPFGFEGAQSTDVRDLETRWSDGDAAVYATHKSPPGVGGSQMQSLDNDDAVEILGTGVNSEKDDRFEVHLKDARDS